MKLFLSFTGLLRAIAQEEVTQADLDAGLFYFGCARSHALNPGGAGEYDERINLAKGAQAHEKLVRALERAESENRCRWLKPDNTSRSYSLLNELLCANGLPQLTLPPEVQELGEADGYGYPAVRRIIEAMGSPVEVHY